MGKKHIISLAGDLASGKGAVSRELAERLKYEIYRNGEYFRKLAKENNIKLGIITNGPSKHQWSVEALGIERWINKDNIVVSGDYDINKPDVRIFEIMQEKLQLPNDSLYYVGDSLENDIVGANNAGWKAIWINRYKKKLPKNVDIYKIAENNGELFEIIKKIFEKWNKIVLVN